MCFSKKQPFKYILIEAYDKDIFSQLAFSLGDKLYGFPTFDQQKDKTIDSVQPSISTQKLSCYLLFYSRNCQDIKIYEKFIWKSKL